MRGRPAIRESADTERVSAQSERVRSVDLTPWRYWISGALLYYVVSMGGSLFSKKQLFSAVCLLFVSKKHAYLTISFLWECSRHFSDLRKPLLQVWQGGRIITYISCLREIKNKQKTADFFSVSIAVFVYELSGKWVMSNRNRGS